MSEYTTVSLRKEFVADVEEYIEDEPFGSVKEFVKHLVVQEMESDDEISEGRLVGSVRNPRSGVYGVSGMAGERAVGLPDRLAGGPDPRVHAAFVRSRLHPRSGGVRRVAGRHRDRSDRGLSADDRRAVPKSAVTE